MFKAFSILYTNVVLILVFLLPDGVMAEEFDPFENPDAFVASYLAENRDKIAQLVTVCQDTTKPAADRIEALVALRKILPDAALPSIVKLIEDDDAEVAAKAAELLSSASMMMNHAMPESPDTDHADNPFMKYAMARHDLIFDTLHKSLDDDRPDVRGFAASSLSASSDEKAVAKIIEASDSGAYPEEEAVKYLSLASPEVAGDYLTKYLESKNTKVLTPVSQYLAESKFGAQVRDKVLLNPEAPLKSRQECAKLLPTEDLVPLFVSPETPELLYSSVLDEYVKRRGDKLTKPQVDHLLKGMEKFGPNPSAKTKEIRGKLDNIIKDFGQETP